MNHNDYSEWHPESVLGDVLRRADQGRVTPEEVRTLVFTVLHLSYTVRDLRNRLLEVDPVYAEEDARMKVLREAAIAYTQGTVPSPEERE